MTSPRSSTRTVSSPRRRWPSSSSSGIAGTSEFLAAVTSVTVRAARGSAHLSGCTRRERRACAARTAGQSAPGSSPSTAGAPTGGRPEASHASPALTIASSVSRGSSCRAVASFDASVGTASSRTRAVTGGRRRVGRGTGRERTRCGGGEAGAPRIPGFGSFPSPGRSRLGVYRRRWRTRTCRGADMRDSSGRVSREKTLPRVIMW